ncbi:MAG: hypothetical protein ACLR43_08665 [Faecalibacillus faecis]
MIFRKEDFSLENSVKEYAVKEKKHQDRYHRYQILGIALCILSVSIFIFLNYEF